MVNYLCRFRVTCAFLIIFFSGCISFLSSEFSSSSAASSKVSASVKFLSSSKESSGTSCGRELPLKKIKNNELPNLPFQDWPSIGKSNVPKLQPHLCYSLPVIITKASYWIEVLPCHEDSALLLSLLYDFLCYWKKAIYSKVCFVKYTFKLFECCQLTSH